MTQKSILIEAEELVHEDRNKAYGHPFEAFSRTAKIWTAILGCQVSPQQVALCMIGVKISREVNMPARDNRVDIAGYAETLDMVDNWEPSEDQLTIKNGEVLFQDMDRKLGKELRSTLKKYRQFFKEGGLYSDWAVSLDAILSSHMRTGT